MNKRLARIFGKMQGFLRAAVVDRLTGAGERQAADQIPSWRKYRLRTHQNNRHINQQIGPRMELKRMQ